MNLTDIVSGGSVLALLAAAIKVAVDYIASRRARRAHDSLAEGSVGPTLVEKSFAASDAQIVFLEKANAQERASYERRIKALEADVKRLTAERDGLYRTVHELRTQAAAMQDQLDAMKDRLEALHPPTN